MNIKFAGKRALVTGGGRGIGRGIAEKLLECGAETCVIDKTQSDLDSLKEECPSIKIVQCDLCDQEATYAAVRSCGPIDLLVNNAGIGFTKSFLRTTLESFDRLAFFSSLVSEVDPDTSISLAYLLKAVPGKALDIPVQWIAANIYSKQAVHDLFLMTMQVNARAPLQISQIVAKGMIERKSGGSIVNISSKASSAALSGLTAYGASKAALDQMTRVMCLELAKHNIRVNAVNPTIVNAPMGREAMSRQPKYFAVIADSIPMGRFAEIDDIVSAVIFLLSDAASMVNGLCLPVDGGGLNAKL